MLGWDSTRWHVLFPAPPSRSEKRFDLARAGIAALERRGLDVQLHHLAGIPNEQVPVWLNAAHVVVLTSSREGSPNAVKEALACNVPVVSVDVGDVRERIESIDGCFIALPNAGDIAVKLEQALARPERIDARAHIAELSLDRTASRLSEIYRIVATVMPSP
jgi:glycosyltransferase involved in cell wall biosynthesis